MATSLAAAKQTSFQVEEATFPRTWSTTTYLDAPAQVRHRRQLTALHLYFFVNPLLVT